MRSCISLSAIAACLSLIYCLYNSNYSLTNCFLTFISNENILGPQKKQFLQEVDFIFVYWFWGERSGRSHLSQKSELRYVLRGSTRRSYNLLNPNKISGLEDMFGGCVPLIATVDRGYFSPNPRFPIECAPR